METSTDSSAGTIIKSDRTGRTRYTAEFKREVLDAFEASSLSAPAFARQCGIKYPTLAAWIAGRKREDHPSLVPAERPAFLLAEVAAATDRSGLEVRLPGGAVARVTDSGQIKLLVELLRHLS